MILEAMRNWKVKGTTGGAKPKPERLVGEGWIQGVS